MPSHDTPLIATIVAGLGLAFLFGLAMQRLRLPPLVGYLLAGVAVGPFTPGFVADASLASELAEIGVILLMFAVGLHFSLGDLAAVRAISIPGAVAQIAVATALGTGFGMIHGWGVAGGVVFGLALSVASTVVLLRALQERRILETERGRIAVGWLVVEDIAIVLALVLLPLIADAGEARGAGAVAEAVLLTLGKVVAFALLMLVVGRKVIPLLLHYVAHTGSRELFRLAVYAVALGVAFGAAKLFGVSFALGAFLAGMVLAESQLSQRAAQEALPLRDAFAVLFFVSVGMLFDPMVLLRDPLGVVATLLIIVVGKSLAAYAIVRAFGHPASTALTISAALAQIGEFSFIVIGLGVALELVPTEARDLVLAGAILSILLNPLAFRLAERRRDRIAPEPPAPRPAATEVPRPAAAPAPREPVASPAAPAGHDIVAGWGRVGSVLGAGLLAAGRTVVAIEDRDEAADAAHDAGAELLRGHAADPEVLAAARPMEASRLFVTLPDPFEAGQVIEQARHANPAIEIVVRAHSDADVQHFASLGATLTVMGEREIARRMLEHAGWREVR
ncbi:MAG TPA: YbaL family putative K(+) efflux transporter [Acetobacteraceae bacterium]|nr:YbaL family putative K(+) efflux transporter [Acetobacteraceae bacterium]